MQNGPCVAFLITLFVYGDKVEVNLSLCFTKHHAMKAYWGVEV